MNNQDSENQNSSIPSKKNILNSSIEIDLAMYRVFFDSFQIGITVTDTEGNIVNCNKKAEELLGLKKEAHIKRHIIDRNWKIINRNFQPFPHEEFPSYLALKYNKIIENVEMGVMKPDNNVIWINVTAAPIPLENFGVAIIYNDITEKIKAEEEIKRIGNYYQALIEKTTDGIVLINAEGDFIYASPAARRMFGYSATEKINFRPDERTHPEDLEIVTSELTKIFINPDYIPTIEYRFADKFGNWKWVESTFTNLLQDVNVKAIVINFRDISLRKKSELELLEVKNKAVESDKLKSAFLANMSHEIRTPMNGIIGFTDLLKTPGLSEEENNCFINNIQRSGNRLLNIINEIIDISKIESGQMKLFLSNTNIIEQFNYLYSFFKPEAAAKNLAFGFKTDFTVEDAAIYTDKEKIYAILTNLIKNSIKYTNSGEIEFGCEKKSEYFVFYVKDTGVGIPYDRQEAVFERFVQADIEDKKALEGAGLGLSITSAYIKMLNGKIWLESEERKGTTVYFSIPIKQKENGK